MRYKKDRKIKIKLQWNKKTTTRAITKPGEKMHCAWMNNHYKRKDKDAFMPQLEQITDLIIVARSNS